jgi:Uma2 family endonuclease
MQVQQRYYTPEEYLALEETAEQKSEYRDGKIVPMTGGTTNHNQISLNISLALSTIFRRQDYRIYMADVRLWIPEKRIYTYPDVMVIAGRPEYYSNRRDTVTNPQVLIEVLSESTRAYDRSEKFQAYSTIASFQEYILVDQTKISIEQFSKTGIKQWAFRLYDEEDEAIELTSVPVQIALADLYDKVEFGVEEQAE